MAYLVGSMSLQVYTDANQTNFPQQTILYETPAWTDNSITGAQVLVLSLAGNGTQTVNLNGLSSVTGFYFYSNTTAVNVNLNGIGNISFAATTPGYVPASVTSMVLTNASSTTATTVTIGLIVG